MHFVHICICIQLSIFNMASEKYLSLSKWSLIFNLMYATSLTQKNELVYPK